MLFKSVSLLVLSFICINSAFSQNKKVCFSIDDLPVVNYGINKKGFKEKVTNDIIAHFNNYNIPAIGYVNESKLYKQGKLSVKEIDLLKTWLANGYELGNHTFSHPNYDQVGFESFSEDILKGAKVTPTLAKEYKLPYRYFRHPFLHMGKTKVSADSLSSFLKGKNYIEAPVTIDNDDYLFAKAYHNAYVLNDSVLMNKIGETYIVYMEEKLHYFEGRSEALFGRNIAHVLLLHANLLNSIYLDELAEMFIKNGYSFASQEEVLKDSAYNTEITSFGDYGISWLDRWALSVGKKGDYFKGDPVTPKFVVELSQK